MRNLTEHLQQMAYKGWHFAVLIICVILLVLFAAWGMNAPTLQPEDVFASPLEGPQTTEELHELLWSNDITNPTVMKIESAVLNRGLAVALLVDEPPVIYGDEDDGAQKDVTWLHDNYGDVQWQRTDPHPDTNYVYRLTELRAKCGPAVVVAKVEDEEGNPIGGQGNKKAIIRYWPGAPDLPWYDPPASRWTNKGIVGKTNAEGEVGFGYGGGDYYWPPDGGVTKMYVADYQGPSDLVTGLGMVGETNHCAIYPTWERMLDSNLPTPVPPTPTPEPGTPTPTPTPEPPPSGCGLVCQVTRMADALESIAAALR